MVSVNRVAALASLCCFLSCSSDDAPVRQSSDTAQSLSADAVVTDSAAVHTARPTGSCPGIPAIDNSMLPNDASDAAVQLFLISPLRFGDTETSLLNCLGTPLKIAVDTIANIHTGEPDNILDITYPGIRYTIYRILADGKEILFRVEAFAPTEELVLGIRVGVPWSHVLQELGTPTSEDQSPTGGFVAHYVVDQFVEETVTFWVDDGIVSKIIWDYYID